ncbi:MAG: hypothetical protein JST84_14655 [Acidobacteria bacterium]|nr:hypothetical protein [Acidobacteriota bacterium]
MMNSKTTRMLGIVILAALWLTAPATAQSPDKILKQATKALGGEKAFNRIVSWQANGTIVRQRDNRNGKIQILRTRPNLYLQFTDFEGFESRLAYSGKSGWRRDSRDGLRTLIGQESLDFQLEASYHNNRWFNAKKDKLRLIAAGTATINEKAANVVTLISNRNIRIKLYFDAASGLLLREEIPAGETTHVYEYSDFRIVNGVQEAHAIRFTAGNEQYEIRLETITHNPAIDRTRFEFPKISNEPLPDVQALLKAVDENEERVEKLLDNYGYTETSTKREINKDGSVKETSETEDVSFYKGRRIRRLIARNGKPLSEKDQADEIREVEKRIKKIEEKIADEAKGKNKREADQPGDDDRKFSLVSLFRGSTFVNPRRERFREREVIVFDFEPNPNYKGGKGIEKFGSGQAGAVWIDPKDKQVVRVESRFIKSLGIGGGLIGSLKEGSTFMLEAALVNDELWLPSLIEINVSVRALIVGLSFNQSIRYSDYKRFNVDAEKEKLIAPNPTKPKPE